MNTAEIPRWQRFAAHFFWVLAAVALAVLFALSSHYAYTKPMVANSATGRTYSNNYHGRVVFLTLEEAIPLYVAEGALVISIIGFAAIVGKAIGRK